MIQDKQGLMGMQLYTFLILPSIFLDFLLTYKVQERRVNLTIRGGLFHKKNTS